MAGEKTWLEKQRENPEFVLEMELLELLEKIALDEGVVAEACRRGWLKCELTEDGKDQLITEAAYQAATEKEGK